jgi:hypothetical protein
MLNTERKVATVRSRRGTTTLCRPGDARTQSKPRLPNVGTVTHSKKNSDCMLGKLLTCCLWAANVYRFSQASARWLQEHGCIEHCQNDRPNTLQELADTVALWRARTSCFEGSRFISARMLRSVLQWCWKLAWLDRCIGSHQIRAVGLMLHPAGQWLAPIGWGQGQTGGSRRSRGGGPWGPLYTTCMRGACMWLALGEWGRMTEYPRV